MPSPPPVSTPSIASVIAKESAEPEPLLDAWSLNAREDGDACRAELKASGLKSSSLPDQKAVDKNGCGIPHGVIVMKGPTGIVYDPPIMVDCTMARALSSIEKIVQEEDMRTRRGPAIVLRDYPERPRSTAREDDRRRFLHAVFQRFRREADLTYAVGPDFNAIHHNHFHLDRGGWHFWSANATRPNAR